jgi:hypothetical protein
MPPSSKYAETQGPRGAPTAPQARPTSRKVAATTIDTAGVAVAVNAALYIARAYGTNIPDGVGEQVVSLAMVLGAVASRLIRKWLDRR